jgi:two-component system phosphate regulon sensor histidine kinase PhoR
MVLIFFIFCLLYYSGLNYYLNKQIDQISDSNFQAQKINIDKSLDPNIEELLTKFKRFEESKIAEIENLHLRDTFRKEFLGNVSHELRTPLFTAQGYILTLLGDTMDDPDLLQKYLNRANKSLERLDAIVKDLDVISRLETGMKLNYSNFNIVSLVNDVFEMLEMNAAKRNITLSFDKLYDAPLLVNADIEKIQQLLINLITNSINYGKLGGKTIVSIRSHSRKKLIIKIADNGIGIDPVHIPRLFERFYRADKSRSREHGGSGLGLAIVKHIVEAHDQELFVESNLGKGSVFGFTLNKLE